MLLELFLSGGQEVWEDGELGLPAKRELAELMTL